jgi:hypothetical protein
MILPIDEYISPFRRDHLENKIYYLFGRIKTQNHMQNHIYKKQENYHKISFVFFDE